MNLKEKSVAAVAGVVVLYAVAAATWFLSAESAWSKAAKRYNEACRKYEKETKLIQDRRKWTEEYDSKRAAMPMFALNQSTDTTWLGSVEELAKTNHVLITQINSGREEEHDDVLELPIQVGSFECSLEALVGFLYALENSEDALFAVRDLSLQPNRSKRGYLKGSLSLTCAYMRDATK